MTWLLILGAGASYGSEPSEANRPPLGTNLFDALAEFDPTVWNSVSTTQQGLLREDFESGLKNLFDLEQGTKLWDLQNSMAQYFFDFQPSPKSMYQSLAERLKSSKAEGVISTLNYERLLYLALKSEEVPFVDRAGEDPPDRLFLILYPHGCSDLIIGGGNASSGNRTNTPNAILTDGPVIRADGETFKKAMAMNQVPVCVMSYFVASKDSPTGPNFINAQREEYSDWCNKADQIAVVGVRVREHDTHIWAPLAQTTAPIMYCSGTKAGEEYREWAARQGRNHDKVLEDYFEVAFDQIIAHLGI